MLPDNNFSENIHVRHIFWQIADVCIYYESRYRKQFVRKKLKDYYQRAESIESSHMMKRQWANTLAQGKIDEIISPNDFERIFRAPLGGGN
jgi:hypothetical protein